MGFSRPTAERWDEEVTMKHLMPLIFLLSSAALADWQTLHFDLTKKDSNAYATDIPAEAFTPGGLRLTVRPGAQYSLMSKRAFSDEFNFELQVEVAERSEKGPSGSISSCSTRSSSGRSSAPTRMFR
jgi:hypothetical protein